MPEYFCADCGKLLSKDERPCSDCGSTKRKISLILEDKIGVKDSISKEIMKLTDDVSFLVHSFESFSKAVTRVYFVMLLLFIVCFLFLISAGACLKFERLIYASTGVLMFISIFAILLIIYILLHRLLFDNKTVVFD